MEKSDWKDVNKELIRKMMLCPCGSNIDFDVCCAPYLAGKKMPLTPEALMRSRYTAFTQKNIDYIARTMKGEAISHFNPNETLAWMGSIQWQGLEVLEAKLHPGKNKGTVEFVAHYEQNGKQMRLHEKSKFRRDKGIWYYTGGIHQST